VQKLKTKNLKQNPFYKHKPSSHCLLLFFIFSLLICRSSFAADLLLSSPSVLPGETLRVEINGVAPDRKMRVDFRGGKYPLYVVGPSAQRALIGIALGEEPGVYPLQVLDISVHGRPYPELAAATVEVATRTYTIENVNFSKQKTELMNAERLESALIGQKKKYLSRTQLWEGSFAEPVKGPLIGEFGLKRFRNKTIEAGFHKGVDIRAAEGAPVIAPNHGIVMLSSNFRAHGKTVMLNHGQGVMSIFLHFSRLKVHPGQQVKKGDVIGLIGSTGLATAPHLHWQVYVHGVPVDPQQWLSNEY